jgi:hypothetical protein
MADNDTETRVEDEMQIDDTTPDTFRREQGFAGRAADAQHNGKRGFGANATAVRCSPLFANVSNSLSDRRLDCNGDKCP